MSNNDSYCIKMSSGEFIAIIDGFDLMKDYIEEYYEGISLVIKKISYEKEIN